MKSEPSTRELSLERFSLAHALVLLAGLAGSIRAGTPLICASLGCVSLALLLLACRRALTPNGHFGLANALTALRVVLVVVLAAPLTVLSIRGGALLAIIVLLLDGLDGAVARRRGEASPFGAYFDMETDALFVLITTLRLYLLEGYGAWVLTAGVLRYAYVLAVRLLPGSGREAPRSLLGRIASSSLALGLIAGLALPGALGSLSALAGTLIVSASFAHSFYYCQLSS
ncbi:MAG TPA: CDP-alcohol phosphatidyltransferase family protein [Polyangiaceae bacterium]